MRTLLFCLMVIQFLVALPAPDRDRDCTALLAVGCHMILFTTGRGTPVGTGVPTIKVSTNRTLAEKKSNWIDFDASPMLENIDPTDDLLKFVIDVANGTKTKKMSKSN
mgnify:CR=1 FL=1